ncbi:MAG: TrkH family potassium uptake protein [Blautia sp.]|jgi:trk system potassium uptake protein TrkH
MFFRQKRITPEQVIIAGFGFTILLGALLLMLPFATKDGNGATFFDAVFTSTSAACVTGLVVHDTFTYWSIFGQAVILMLIQVGGMGVVTMAIAVFIFTGRKIGLKERFLMQESISAPQVGGIVRLTSFILKATLAIEGIGALLLALRFCPKYGLGLGLWYSLFHSISAFCNAGFDLMGRQEAYSSLTAFTDDPVINLTVMLLIIIGGIGFFVWDDIRRNKLRFRLYRLHTKMVLVTTFALLVLPALYFFFLEFGRDVWGFKTNGERLLATLFQTVTPRTAGFNTVNLTKMTEPALFITIFLMVTGGSPSSTAGGYKTTTLATLVLCARSVFRKDETIQSFGRRFPPEIIRRAVTLFTVYLLLFITGGLIICSVEGIPLLSALFETASAIGTVGLSLGITPGLAPISRAILIALMFFGRVGGLTLIYAVANKQATPFAQMPQEKIIVG